MDPPYQPANITFDNSNFNPNFDTNSNGNGNINNNNNNNNNFNNPMNVNNNNVNNNNNPMPMPMTMNHTGNSEHNGNNQMASGSNDNGQGNSSGTQMQMQTQSPTQNQNPNPYQYQQSPNGYQPNMNFQAPSGPPPMGPPPPMMGYQNSGNGNGYQYTHNREPSVQYNHNHNRDQSNLSGGTTRTNTWVQTPAGPFPPQFQQPSQSYFPGPVDANGYPIDVKGKQPYVVEEHSVQSTPAESRRVSMDMEKQKEEVHAAEPHDPHKKDPNQPVLPWGQRLKHFTWAWYTLTMATGGISTLIAIQPHAFKGLITIGAVFYVVNLIFFAILNTCMVVRFTKFPGMFKESIKHEREALFLGPFFLSVATIITGTQKYIVESYEVDHPTRGWIITSMAIVFWAYVFMTFCLAVFQYSFLFCAHTYPLMKFMPSWLLPIFPIMLAGTIASVIAKDQPVSSRMPIIAAGLGCQGLGFTVSILMYAHYIGRLMQAGYPNREHRGAMFIGVGPPSFTCLAFIGMANALPDDFDLQGDGLIDAHLLRTMAIVSALFLWVLAMWFFMVALIAVLHSRPEYFHLGWWAMVFPNTGFIIATISIGNSLKDETILFVANGLTIAVLCMWVFVFYHNVRAVVVADIMYPGRDEDVED